MLTRRESRSIVFEGKEETHGQRFGTRRARGDDPFPDDPGEDGVIHFGLPRRLGDGHLFDPAGFVDAEGQFHAVFPVDALRDLDLPLEDGRIFWYSTEGKESLLSGGPMLERIDRVLEGCSAVVCYNDEVASRLVTHLMKKGVSIPQEVAVVSFDNSQYSELSPLRITSLSHGSYNVGRMAAEMLLAQLQGKPSTSQVAPWVLVEKESS